MHTNNWLWIALVIFLYILIALIVYTVVVYAWVALQILFRVLSYQRQGIERSATDFGEFVRSPAFGKRERIWTGKIGSGDHNVVVMVPESNGQPDSVCLDRLGEILERLAHFEELARQDASAGITSKHHLSVIDLWTPRQITGESAGDSRRMFKLGFYANLDKVKKESIYLSYDGDQIVGDVEISSARQRRAGCFPFVLITRSPSVDRGRN